MANKQGIGRGGTAKNGNGHANGASMDGKNGSNEVSKLKSNSSDGNGTQHRSAHSQTKDNEPRSSAPVVHLSLPAILLTIILASTLAFFAGTAYGNYVLELQLAGKGELRANSTDNDFGSQPWEVPTHGSPGRTLKSMGSQKRGSRGKLPAPRLHDGKAWPKTRYTGKVFPEDGKGKDAVRESHDLHIQPSSSVCTSDEEEEEQCNAEQQAGAASTNVSDADDEHLPAGQHLLVDIKNVDADFLDSEKRLAEAMVEVVSLSRLTLLSYHCHSLVPAGVSCVGVLLESHISFHTWPDEGVITLDLFTCGSGKLVPVVPVIERLFGVPQEGAGKYHPPPGTSNESYVPREEDYHEEPLMVWSHVLRGFRPRVVGKWDILENDVSDFALKIFEMDYKKVVTTSVTPYQQIDVVDIIDPRHQTMQGYKRSLRPEVTTYESAHPELFRPNRMVFLDGVIQSTSRGDESYHEALVHPGMFAHDNPQKVAIVGGGEGSTLREVLKHRTVKNVAMIEIDEMMVNKSREFLPDWSDCSDLRGSATSCFDDPRTDLHCEDALAWFIDRYGDKDIAHGNEEDSSDGDEEDSSDDEEESSDDDEEDSSDDDEDDSFEDGELDIFDVIIMDALDPQDNVEFADALYDNESFIRALYSALSDDGILVLQLGISPSGDDPADEFTESKNRAMTMSMIEAMGFESMHVYEESHCGFQAPWSFLVACKSFDCRFNWFANEATIQVEIHHRIKRTLSGEASLKYFDGATMKSYQIPSKAWETVYCRKEPAPADCSKYRGFDKNVVNYGAENFEVRMSSIGEDAGRGTFAKVDIPKGSYVMQEQAPTKIHFTHDTFELIEKLYEIYPEADDLEDVLRYAYGYGFQHKLVADYEYYVDSGAMTFVNHGCNGTNNIEGEVKNDVSPDDPFFNEATLDPTRVAARNPVNLTAIFNPVVDRNMQHLASSFDVATRNIKAGEELFQNYLYFISDADDWVNEVRDLQAQCRGEALGEIKENEMDDDDNYEMDDDDNYE